MVSRNRILKEKQNNNNNKKTSQEQKRERKISGEVGIIGLDMI